MPPRTKADKNDELGLPLLTVMTQRTLFDDDELDFYAALDSETRTRFDTFVREGTALRNYARLSNG